MIAWLRRLVRWPRRRRTPPRDPFAGIGSVPYQAISMGRHGWGVELNSEYFKAALHYCQTAEAEAIAPTLFDFGSPAGVPAGNEGRAA